MHVVLRTWPDAKIVEVLLQHKGEVERLMKEIPGFSLWHLLRFTDGTCGTATVCRDKAGCDRSMELAREWVAKNAPDIDVSRMQARDAEVLSEILA